MILSATHLAIRIRDICNHWPQYSHMKRETIPNHSRAIDLADWNNLLEVEENAEALRDKQAYLQSLHTN